MERERRLVFFISWARSSPARQREREQDARLQIEVRLSFKVGEYIYMQQAHQQYTSITTAYTLKKHVALDAPCSVRWIIFPKVLPVSFD